MISGKCKILRVYTSEGDRYEGAPLHSVIINKVKESGLAGATVFRGVEGFGATNFIHKVRPLGMSDKLPLVIEIVDKAERINTIVPIIDAMVKKGLITIDDTEVMAYRHKDGEVEGDAPAA